MKTTKIAKGYYETIDKNGTTWVIEHVTKIDGFAHDEWHCGTKNDPHADQCDTKRECLKAIEYFVDHPE